MRGLCYSCTVAVAFLAPGAIVRQAHATPRQSCDGPRYVGTACVGSDLAESALFVRSDAAGRIITGGEWSCFDPGYVVDFDPTDGVDEKVGFGGDDVYVTVGHADGSYAWTNTFGGDGDEDINDLAIGAGGRIFVVGSFFRRFGDDPALVDFDPGPGVDFRECPSDSVCSFVTRYGVDGEYLGTWTNGSPGGRITVFDLEFDVLGNMYYSGFFQDGRFDLNPRGGEDFYEADEAITTYVTKINADGRYAWTLVFKTALMGLESDIEGNIYVAGEFACSRTYDFDPGPGEDWHGGGCRGEKAFITRINADLSYGWTHMVAWADTSGLRLTSLDVDADGIYIGGSFYQYVEFDPDGKPEPRSDDGGTAWLAKLTLEGDYQWVYAIPSDDGSSSVRSVSSDRHGNIYLLGHFGGETNFDHDGEGDWHFGGGNSSAFVTKLGADRSYRWTAVVGGSGSMYPWNIEAASDGRLVFSGGFYSPRGVDFDPTDGEDIRRDNGVEDAFVTTWLCNDCEALLSHGLWAKPRGAVISRVTTNVAGGRVKVQLTSDDGVVNLSDTRRVRADGRVRTRVDGLPPGRYDVQIQWIEDQDGARLCDGPLMERSVVLR